MAVHARDHPAVHPTVCIIDICFIDGLGLKKEERLTVEAVDLRAPIFGGVPAEFFRQPLLAWDGVYVAPCQEPVLIRFLFISPIARTVFVCPSFTQ